MSKIRISFLVITSFLLVSLSAYAQLSTSGPTRPEGVDEGLRPPSRAQVIIPDVPYYIWHHGCGPTALGMVIGYYDVKGFRHLVEGDADGQSYGVDKMIADDNSNTDCGNISLSDHYRDYACPIDNFSNIQTDKSVLGGAHEDNCVADFMNTSQSLYGLPYGWSGDYDMSLTFGLYVNYVAPHYVTTTEQKTFWSATWEEYKVEIDAGRPVVFLVDTDGDGITDHFITATGYEEDGGINYYGCHDTWDENMHWYQWRSIAEGVSWGIYSMTKNSCSYTPRTINVPSEYETIQAAVDRADIDDTIKIAPGVYSGPGNRDILLEGQPVIYSTGGAEATIIDCEGSSSEQHQGFIIEAGFGPETKISGLTIRNAYKLSNGGAIKCSNSSLLISDCIFENNHAIRGGGMTIYGSTPTISNCIFRNNDASEGGAIYLGNFATPLFENCFIENNTGSLGGGINSNLSMPIIQNCIISGNSAGTGGGYYNNNAAGEIYNSNFCMNSSSNGAAIHLKNSSTGLTIENCIIAFNNLDEAVYCYSASWAPAINCTDIYGNEGGDWTGGIAGLQAVNNNFSGDPLFCNMVNGDYSLYITSPCMAANSNCGTLVGCDDTECLILYICGDIDNNESVDILDVVYLINFKYKEGPPPQYMNAADVNNDSEITILDAVYIINFRYKEGPAPNCP